MSDLNTYPVEPDSPPSRAIDITPNDSDDLTFVIRGLMVAEAGNVAVETVLGDTVTLPALQPGAQYAILCRKVLAAGTTATGIVGLA
jgi:hypothetical protein